MTRRRITLVAIAIKRDANVILCDFDVPEYFQSRFHSDLLQRRRQILPKNINAQGFSILKIVQLTVGGKSPKGAATVRDGKVAAEEILSGTSCRCYPYSHWLIGDLTACNVLTSSSPTADLVPLSPISDAPVLASHGPSTLHSSTLARLQLQLGEKKALLCLPCSVPPSILT